MCTDNNAPYENEMDSAVDSISLTQKIHVITMEDIIYDSDVSTSDKKKTAIKYLAEHGIFTW